ncbi:MAG: protein kinase [Polyangiaceae bacterium]|nr:protein kinase [Polyangiaceae bacterium]
MKVLDRYLLLDELARGGMATVHFGRLLGPVGFSRTVAIKRLHPHLAKDEEFVAMFADEARLIGRIQHPNVVSVLDVVSTAGELFLVMDYVQGETLVRLLKVASSRGVKVPPAIASAILVDTLRGLHAAHEATAENGDCLGIIHRDVTPHNIMVRRDGTSVVVDFGVAKAQGRFHTTEEGKIKGKLPYMAPEQVRAETLTRRVDIYAAGVVLWETLVGERLVRGKSEAEVLERVVFGTPVAPGSVVHGLPAALDEIVLRALSRAPTDRYETAEDMARDLEERIPPALPSRVRDWLMDLVGVELETRSQRVARLEAEHAVAVAGANSGLAGTPTKIDAARPIPEIVSVEAARVEASPVGPRAEPPAPVVPFSHSTATLTLPNNSSRSSGSRWPVLVIAGLGIAGGAAWWGLNRSQTARETASPVSEPARPAPSDTSVPANAVSTPPSAPAEVSSAPSGNASTSAPATSMSVRVSARPATAQPRPAPTCQPSKIVNGKTIYNRKCAQ